MARAHRNILEYFEINCQSSFAFFNVIFGGGLPVKIPLFGDEHQ
jgi:hypothetical protein